MSSSPIAGADLSRPVDALFVNAPLRDYTERPRVNNFTLPVLGMSYIATYATHEGFNVGILDAEAGGLSVGETADVINGVQPRWVGMNLLAPTYELSARIAAGIDPGIHLMVGGHHARALPTDILLDPRMAQCEALLIGEAETRVVELLKNKDNRAALPGLMWFDGDQIRSNPGHRGQSHLTPDINALPFVDRNFLANDPFENEAGLIEASMVGARGCPYDCSFCGAAVSANPDVTIRVRDPRNIIDEMQLLRKERDVTAFRFVDDLFLGASRVIADMMNAFRVERIGEWARWDATGRINVLARESDSALELLKKNGLHEVALGIESGSDRMLMRIDKRINQEMIVQTVHRLLSRGINVKGYFILGMPGETRAEVDMTVCLVNKLWDLADNMPADFRASVFEYRPYPGTPDWARLMKTGQYRKEDLLAYAPVDLSTGNALEFMRERDEFNFSVNLKLSDVSLEYIRNQLVQLARIQYDRARSKPRLAVPE